MKSSKIVNSIWNRIRISKASAPRGWQNILKWLMLRLVLWFVILSVGSVILFRWVPIPFTPLMLIRTGEQLVEGRPLRLYKDWEPIEDISPKIQLAVVCGEDQKYLEHMGFDLENIKKAIGNNKKGRRIRGASTISQQTAKNLFLWPGRSWIRKGFEVYFTLLIEVFWSKERILEVYLNIVEMGEGIYGAQAASQYYFRKDAKNLNKSEGALIAACLPNPRKYLVNAPGSYIRNRQRWIMNQMRYWGGGLDFEDPSSTPGQ